MDAKRMWKQFGVDGKYEKWSFGTDANPMIHPSYTAASPLQK